LRGTPRYDYALAACEYVFPIDRLIRRFKFDHYLAAAPLLAELLAETIERHGERPDLIVPVPLARARLRARGFNQALELARLLGQRFSLPLAADACSRPRHGDAQSNLPIEERVSNVRGAFVCVQDLRGVSVAVVDDVLTTGATLNELAEVLRRAGAARVVGWVAARTPAAAIRS
jgi:ComF family protein